MSDVRVGVGELAAQRRFFGQNLNASATKKRYGACRSKRNFSQPRAPHPLSAPGGINQTPDRYILSSINSRSPPSNREREGRMHLVS
mmetsp:Transcript_18933/g.40996  ORF Transcript_18933/g.40996 Transcript_18933/m.40996 type:complete len:87 (-) Transcript_18933:81-341(-)